jgi:hypothetical protein
MQVSRQRDFVDWINWTSTKLYWLYLVNVLSNQRFRISTSNRLIGLVRGLSGGIVFRAFKNSEWPLRSRNTLRISSPTMFRNRERALRKFVSRPRYTLWGNYAL